MVHTVNSTVMRFATEICINMFYRSFFANRMRHQSLQHAPNSTHTKGGEIYWNFADQ